MHMVVANELLTHKDKVVVVTSNEKISVRSYKNQALYSSFNAIQPGTFYLLLGTIFPYLCLSQSEHDLVTLI
ncbi:hypothetical protein CFP56_020216 [Quercus suber]|uniref:Uncharacterized protein n=1 Tax=Quercus suber TaxID=58331 RepID=A0AAW0KH09_QUESU